MTENAWRLLDKTYPSTPQNMALEEALSRSAELPTFPPTIRLWIDPPSVVVGRFQDVEAEVDTALCEQNGIQIARRFTGGGAVYHDEGTLNFTVVMRRQDGVTPASIHETNCSVISSLLDSFGLRNSFVAPNSILVSGKKISGAAAALGNNFALWHASILVSTNAGMLTQVLSPSRRHKMTNFVRSRWQPVTTMQSVLGESVEIDEVKRLLLEAFANQFVAKPQAGPLSKEEELSAHSLFHGKYSSREWSFRRSC